MTENSLDDLGFDPSRFKLGSLCKRGHRYQGREQSLRYAKTNWCVGCAADSYRENREKKVAEAAQRRAEKGDEIRLRRREVYAERIELMRERDRLRYKRDREKRKASVMRRYYSDIEKGREKIRQGYHKHRLKRRAYWKTAHGKMLTLKQRVQRQVRLQTIHSSSYTASELESRLKAFDGCCYCGDTSCKLTIDHFIPISKGGSDAIGNLLPACSSCNSSKNDSDPMEWYEQQMFFSKARWQKILRVLGKQPANYNQIPLL